MIKDLTRIIGSACILASAILYFFPNTSTEQSSENVQLKSEVSALQSKLDDTTKELASLQLSLKESEKPAEENNKEKAEETVEAKSDEAASSSVPSGTATLLIESGMGSTTVANELAKAGIIEDAAAFELYLTQNKLAGKIQIGEYELNESMSYQEIIDRITSSK